MRAIRKPRLPSNIEIKARVEDLDQLRSTAARLATEPCQTLHQEDIFFCSTNGRLKLRIFSESGGELIYYERPDIAETKQSNYEIYKTFEPQVLREVLSAALGESVIVKKTRDVYLVGQTRIHLDEVEGLGAFIELEVVLRPNQTIEEGRRIADELMTKLCVQKSDLVSCAYADLLLGRTEQGTPLDGDSAALHPR